MWQFKTVLCFLNDQIANLQFKERHSRDVSTIIGQEKDASCRKKAYSAGKSSAVRINNVPHSPSYSDRKSSRNQVVRSKGPNEPAKKDLKPDPCCIHPLADHKTIECAQFIEKKIDERRAVAKVNNLCYYCLGKHFACNCPSKMPLILISGHESWVMTRRMRSRVQASKMRFLRRIKGVTSPCKVCH